MYEKNNSLSLYKSLIDL